MQVTDEDAVMPEKRARAQAIAAALEVCLQDLDALDEGLAAVYVSMALEQLKSARSL